MSAFTDKAAKATAMGRNPQSIAALTEAVRLERVRIAITADDTLIAICGMAMISSAALNLSLLARPENIGGVEGALVERVRASAQMLDEATAQLRKFIGDYEAATDA